MVSSDAHDGDRKWRFSRTAVRFPLYYTKDSRKQKGLEAILLARCALPRAPVCIKASDIGRVALFVLQPLTDGKACTGIGLAEKSDNLRSLLSRLFHREITY